LSKAAVEGYKKKMNWNTYNAMQPTGNSMDVIQQLESLCSCLPAGDAGR